MNKFIITVPQINEILAVLGEFPARHVLSAIDILRSGLQSLPDSQKGDTEDEIL